MAPWTWDVMQRKRHVSVLYELAVVTGQAFRSKPFFL